MLQDGFPYAIVLRGGSAFWLYFSHLRTPWSFYFSDSCQSSHLHTPTGWDHSCSFICSSLSCHVQLPLQFPVLAGGVDWSWGHSRGTLVLQGCRGATGLHRAFLPLGLGFSSLWCRFLIGVPSTLHLVWREMLWKIRRNIRVLFLLNLSSRSMICVTCILPLQRPRRWMASAWPRTRTTTPLSILLHPCISSSLTGMQSKKVSKLLLYLWVRSRQFCCFIGEEVIWYWTLSWVILELGGMKSCKNLNKTGMVFSSSKVEVLEVAMRTLQEATS